MNNVYTLKKTETKTFLLVGFEQNIFDLLTPPPGLENDFYYFEKTANANQSVQWLTKQLQQGAKAPYAIIANYDAVSTNDFQFARDLACHAEFRLIPFIVIGKPGTQVDSKALLKLGVDDYFEGSVSSLTLKKRLKFIHQFKPAMIEPIPAVQQEEKAFNMPIGKRLFDILFATGAILALSPVMIAIAIAIKATSRGPVIYRSKRVGTKYRVFDFLKFRSMCPDADAKLKELEHLNHYTGENGNGTFKKLVNDPRITTIGKFIRKTSLDELPQLFNVLRGEMSIVGNRPLPLYEAELMTTDNYCERFFAPAGITGLWQTSGKGKDNMSVEERVGLDIDYARKCSFLMDAKILSRTLPAMIQREE